MPDPTGPARALPSRFPITDRHNPKVGNDHYPVLSNDPVLGPEINLEDDPYTVCACGDGANCETLLMGLAEQERDELKVKLAAAEAALTAERERADFWGTEFDTAHALLKTAMAERDRERERAEAERRVIEAARALARRYIAVGSGPAAPCFDAEDYEVERNRGKWYTVDGALYDELAAALATLPADARHPDAGAGEDREILRELLDALRQAATEAEERFVYPTESVSALIKAQEAGYATPWISVTTPWAVRLAAALWAAQIALAPAPAATSEVE